MVNPLDVLETCLYVDDLVAAERFYTDVLGLAIGAFRIEDLSRVKSVVARKAVIGGGRVISDADPSRL